MALVPHIEDDKREEQMKKIRKMMMDGDADSLLGERNIHIGKNDQTIVTGKTDLQANMLNKKS